MYNVLKFGGKPDLEDFKNALQKAYMMYFFGGVDKYVVYMVKQDKKKYGPQSTNLFCYYYGGRFR